MNSVGYFIGDCLKCAWAWLSSVNLWSNTDESDALVESHLWGLLSCHSSSSPLYQDSIWNLLATILCYFSGISFWLYWFSARTSTELCGCITNCVLIWFYNMYSKFCNSHLCFVVVVFYDSVIHNQIKNTTNYTVCVYLYRYMCVCL